MNKLIKAIRKHENWARDAIEKNDNPLYWFEEYRNGVELLIAECKAEKAP